MSLFFRMLILALVGMTSFASAMDVPIEVECPLGGRNAQGIERLGMAQAGRGLDGRPYGAHVLPIPPPECPDNGFLVYKENFSESELVRLKKYILSEEHQKMWRSGAPAFYRLSKIFEYEGIPLVAYAYNYLIATWEVPSEDKDRYLYYALEAIDAFQAAIDMDSDVESEVLVEFHYLLAELYRRVGDFDNARQQLNWVKQTDYNKDFLHPSFVNYLDYLISHNDSDPHKMSEAENALQK